MEKILILHMLHGKGAVTISNTTLLNPVPIPSSSLPGIWNEYRVGMRTAGRRRRKGGCREQEGVTPGGNFPLCSQEGEGGGDFAFSRYGDPERIEEEEWLMELP